MAIWEGVEEFLAVAESGNFTSAAKRLGVSASHVSRQVAGLENRLGVRLFARSTRVVRMTDAGSEYFARVAGLVDGLKEANQIATGSEAPLSGKIRVSAAGPFAENQVAPVLSNFARNNTEIEIEIDFDSHVVNLIEGGFDFAIRYGDLRENGLIARKLATRPMLCMAARDYVDANGIPTHPKELKSHSCLTTNSHRWIFQDKETGKPIPVSVSGRWHANNLHALRAGLSDGLGIAYATDIFFEPFINSGKFVRLLKGYEDTHRISWIVYPEKRLMPLRVRMAIDFLIEKLAT